MTGLGRFTETEAVLTSVEASDILVAHTAVVESEVHELRFETGETLKVRARVQVNLERMEFREGDGEDQAILEVHSHGKVEFLDAEGAVIYRARWRGNAEEVRVVLNGDRVESFEARLEYDGEGAGPCQGRKIHGQIRAFMAGKDQSGLEILKIGGEGEVSV